jgi:hypothetical protein
VGSKSFKGDYIMRETFHYADEFEIKHVLNKDGLLKIPRKIWNVLKARGWKKEICPDGKPGLVRYFRNEKGVIDYMVRTHRENRN